MSKDKWRFCTKQLQMKARSNYYEMQDESSLKNIHALVLYFFMALGMSFKRQKSGNRPGYLSVGHSAVPDVLPALFVYVCPRLIFCHSKKIFPEKANILRVSGGKINVAHLTVALESQSRLENELEAELIHKLHKRSNIRNPSGSYSWCWRWKRVAGSWQDVVALTGKGLRSLCRALSNWKKLWRSPKGNIEAGMNKTEKDTRYYILLDKAYCYYGFIYLLINILVLSTLSCLYSISY